MSAAYRPGRDVGVTVRRDDRSPSTVYLARLPAGPLLVLEGVAALVWVEATTPPATGWVGRVAQAVQRPEEDIADEVDAFVGDLCARRLVERLPVDGP